MTRAVMIGAAVLAGMLLGSPRAEAQVYDAKWIGKALGKSVPLMQASAGTFQDRMGKLCFSCHHQSVPSMAYAAAFANGYKVDQAQRKRQEEFVYGFIAKAKPLLVAAQTHAAAEKQVDKILVDPTISAGYALFGLAEDGRAADETLTLFARYLAKKQLADGRWPVWAARPPMEGSEITTTALAVRAIRTYAASDPETDERVLRARRWLGTATVRGTEDKAFRLLGLRWAGASEAELQPAVKDLLSDQRDDGGWAQLPGKGSDAYATGQALVALHRGGGLPVEDAAYTRGATYLLMTQQPDGSWKIVKRSTGVQPHFESNFPHGKAQFISIAGTAWATAALADAARNERSQVVAR